MLRIDLDIARIDYEGALELLLPPFLARCAEAPSPGELEKLVRKLGGDALPVAKRLLRYLDTDLKDALVVSLVNRYRGELAAAVNGLLDREVPVGSARIGSLFAQDLPGPRLLLRAEGVSLDYAALLGSQKVADALEQALRGDEILLGAARLLVRTAALLPAERLEKQAVSLLSADKVRQKLLAAVTERLERQSFPAVFRDVQIHSLEKAAPASPAEPEPIPPALTEALTDALAAFLRDAARLP